MSCSTSEHASGAGGPSAGLRVVDVLRRTAPALLREDRLGPEQRRVLLSIRACRTPALGGEVLVCPKCGFEKQVFHSCRNRHCPNCQAQAQEQWIASRAASMLPVPHFHVVFTLPSQLRGLCRAHPAAMYDLLLRSSGDVLGELGQDVLGAQLGVTVVLHTWARDLSYHVHAHCIVTAGGWDRGAAVFRRNRDPRFLFPAARMKAAFRARMLRGLRGLVQQGVITLPDGIAFAQFEEALPPKKEWVVYAKAPFGKFEHVLAYLGRYTHRVGISNSRLRAITETDVTFATRDAQTCTLSHDEFTRRFLAHVLPHRFKKIRHYGLYASGSTQRAVALVTLPAAPPQTQAVVSPPDDPSVTDERLWRERHCPDCDILLVVVSSFPRPLRPPWKPP